MVRIAELEEQVKMLQELTEKNIKELKDFKEEVRKNSQNANVILDELWALMIKHVAKKGKEPRRLVALMRVEAKQKTEYRNQLLWTIGDSSWIKKRISLFQLRIKEA